MSILNISFHIHLSLAEVSFSILYYTLIYSKYIFDENKEYDCLNILCE